MEAQETLANSFNPLRLFCASYYTAVQLPQMQFFKGKSYRGFCPIGPWLTVPDPDEFDSVEDLKLILKVNDAVLSVAGKLVSDPDTMIAAIQRYKVGEVG